MHVVLSLDHCSPVDVWWLNILASLFCYVFWAVYGDSELLQACYCNSGIFVVLSAYVLGLDLWMYDGVVCMGITVSPG